MSTPTLVAECRMPAEVPTVYVQTGKRRCRWRVEIWAQTETERFARILRSSRARLTDILAEAVAAGHDAWDEAEQHGRVVDCGFQAWMLPRRRRP